MNVADKDLCQELYELSGWGKYDTYTYFHTGIGKIQRKPADAPLHIDDTPAYDSGYLLRKLPMYLEIEHPITHRITVGAVLGGRWCASYDDEDGDVRYEQFADTPENALTKLAIELFKRGVLKK